MKYNTRIAPSPTGNMHIGTARTAYFNWLASKASGGRFILRIDDTDQKRNDPAYTQVILDTMKWLGLDYDELVYQSHRFELYKTTANKLANDGWAKSQDGAMIFTLEQRRKEGYIFSPSWKDEIAGDIKITSNDLDNMEGMVLIKNDGSPSYNFCSIVDDLNLGINFIIRGVDHITNTAKQVILWDILSQNERPKFAHVGLICVDGKPMSKRDGASSMLNYMNAGYDPDGMLNFLARLGWSPTKDDKTTSILTKEQMIEMFFSSGKMKNSSAGFDVNKLESFDRKYKSRKGIWRTKEKLL
jgi:glutamyl-tRNA synthetase